MTDPSLDPRYPRVFQRGGGDVPLPEAVPAPSAPEVDPAVLVTGVPPVRVGRAPLEVIVVGNPWMRALWIVGTLALVAGIGLTVAAEFAFSALQSATTFDPVAFLPARLMQVLGLPLIIAGTLGLVAAAVLRLVTWRPAAVREIDAD